MITKMRHTGIVVCDLEVSLNFWRDVMGFRVSKQMQEQGQHLDKMMGLENVQVTTVKLVGPDDSMIELLCFSSHPDKKIWHGNAYSTGLTHIAFTIRNMDEVRYKMSNAGYAIENEPQLSPDGNVKVVYCKGPEGLILELVEVIQKT